MDKRIVIKKSLPAQDVTSLAPQEEACQQFNKCLDDHVKNITDQIKLNFKAHMEEMNSEKDWDPNVSSFKLSQKTDNIFSREMTSKIKNVVRPFLNAKKTKRDKELQNRNSKIRKLISSSLPLDTKETCLQVETQKNKKTVSMDSIACLTSFLPFNDLLNMRLVCKVFSEQASKFMFHAFQQENKVIRIFYGSEMISSNIALSELGLALMFEPTVDKKYIPEIKSALSNWISIDNERENNTVKFRKHQKYNEIRAHLICLYFNIIRSLPKCDMKFVIWGLLERKIIKPTPQLIHVNEGGHFINKDKELTNAQKKKIEIFTKLVRTIENYNVKVSSCSGHFEELHSEIFNAIKGENIQIAGGFRTYQLLDFFVTIHLDGIVLEKRVNRLGGTDNGWTSEEWDGIFNYLKTKPKDSRTTTINMSNEEGVKRLRDTHPEIFVMYQVTCIKNPIFE